MIHEERTRMMTNLAIYEKRHGRRELQITKYASGDYITLHVLYSFVCGTLAFVIIAALGVMYNLETLMLELFQMDILYFARNVLIIYIIFMGVYLSFCYAFLSFRYARCKRRVNKYLMRLKELYRYYVQADIQDI